MDEPIMRDLLAMPFFVADAWLERIVALLNDPGLTPSRLTAKRHQLSTGSARIDVFYRQQKVGSFTLFASSHQITAFETNAEANEKARQIMTILHEHYQPILMMAAVRGTLHNEELQSMRDELHAEAKNINTAFPPEPQEPTRGDSMDTWLDWRDQERHNGRKSRFTSLTRIAKEGGFSLSTLKKRSAARNQVEPQEPK